ncbi:uncharacterized protein RCC_00884 [Ramularia collo-cygni]|uniref:NTF2 domain-containing protein n=1 Tax=Ramularia collo-cygni TaxID=112498 RepID=A0A2D3URD2_9PEZI|nr:uncharacterized protein RCC_00884 [Ramularia collo-cygni]CZT14960.1 uncharacterized protein RCC_00884 [Ramularia collo-cygni]
MDMISKPNLKNVQTQVDTKDIQPAPSGGVAIQVTGKLTMSGDYLPFARMFVLQPMPGQEGGFFVYNDIFRLRV